MTVVGAEAPQWRSDHVWKMPTWFEPWLIVFILFGSMYVTRNKAYSIFRLRRSPYKPVSSPGASTPRTPRSSSNTDPGRPASRSFRSEQRQHPLKRRRVLGIWTVTTPNSSRFAAHPHSRLLAKFPFLVEMFYWVITLLFYKTTDFLSRWYYGGSERLWDVAQAHGLALLEIEGAVFGGGQTGTHRWAEWRIHHWFLNGAANDDSRGVGLTILNRVYALIHIPGTVGFIAYYYWAAPSFTRFATVRRTMTLLNLFAFVIFILYPCAPPRFLPAELGFVDTVNGEDAASMWMSGNFVNYLAAMPSMHFGYAFAIGCVFVHASGFLQSLPGGRRSGKRHSWTLVPGSGPEDDENELEKPDVADAADGVSPPGAVRRVWFLFFGLFYPSLILLAIVSTANHYFSDAFAAALVVLVSFLCNRVLMNFLPLEDWLLWMLRLEKPTPTTGRAWTKAEI
ncbi:Integral membrane protein [Pleurostoma richardsiae]|uniref:Integral membrane protein n=1 Tax=Pleurostoma richardsiae TaxID=41990 RepID=A0AA38R700_9PEZI|nr:Integral membrane protein [Pleurostoma richardsiae]